MQRCVIVYLNLLLLPLVYCKVQISVPLNLWDTSDIPTIIEELSEQFAVGDTEEGIDSMDPMSCRNDIYYENINKDIVINATNVTITGLRTLKIDYVSWDPQWSYTMGKFSLLGLMDIYAVGVAAIHSVKKEPFVTSFSIQSKFDFQYDLILSNRTDDNELIVNDQMFYVPTKHELNISFENAETSPQLYRLYAEKLNSTDVRTGILEKYLKVYTSSWLKALQKFLKQTEGKNLVIL